MNAREQVHFYCMTEDEHWRYMEPERMKAKVNAWIKKIRSAEWRSLVYFSDQQFEKLLSIRDKLKYCIRAGKKGYEVGKYQKLK